MGVKEIKRMEPVTKARVVQLASALGGPIAAMVAGLNEVDISAGSGVYDGGRCLWTKDGHRIEIQMISGGGIIAAKSKAPDPEYPNRAKS